MDSRLNPVQRAALAVGAATRTTIRAASSAADGAISAAGGFVMRFAARASYGFLTLLGRTNIDYAREVGDPTKNSIVVAVVGWIARNFPDAPIRVTLGEPGRDPAIKPGKAGPGRMLRLLERPNEYFSGVLMWMAVIVDLFTSGNAYIVKIRSGVRSVVELWWIPQKMISPAWPTDGSVFIAGYQYRVDGRIYWIERTDVIHLRLGIDPDNPRMGLSKLASLFREIYTDDEAANFTAVLLHNLGVPGVVLAPSNTTGPGQRADPEEIKRRFMDRFGGDQKGEPLVLTAPTDVKVLSWSPEQLNLRELRKIPEERISSVVGVAAMVVGLGAGLDRSTFTNYGEARAAAYEESVIPLQRVVAAELEVQLLTEFADIEQGYDVDFDLSRVRALAEDTDVIWKRNESSATKGLITRAAFKRAVGLPADAGDEVYIYPNNYAVVSAGGNSPGGGQALVLPPGVTGGNGNGQAHALLEATAPLAIGELRCSSCNKLLAERVTAPYRFSCERCGTLNEATVEAAA